MKNPLNTKIIYGLERLSEAFKALLWDKAKTHGISPIQIQILLFISTHKPALCSVSHLAQEFNVTKPTISDAVRVLAKKGLVEKDYSASDSRSYTLHLSEAGKVLFQDLDGYAGAFDQALGHLGSPQREALYSSITELIYQLNQSGVLNVQRTCFGCRFYAKKEGTHYCHFLEKNLIDNELRLDCNDYEKRNHP